MSTPTHLTLPRGGNACGSSGDGTPEINEATCPQCLRIHDYPPVTVEVFGQYADTALWSSVHYGQEAEEGEPMDARHDGSDLAPATVAAFRADLARFFGENAETIGELQEAREDRDDSQVAHDLWLTRNWHGAGFWDGDYPEPYATILSDAAKAMGECELYVGDDDLIYAAGREGES